MEAAEKDREQRIKSLEDEVRVAKETAEQSKKAEDATRAQQLENQLATERQNQRVVAELRMAMNGQRGEASLEKARSLVKTAADQAIAERLLPKDVKGGSGSASLTRGAAFAMVITTLAFLYAVSPTPAQANVYESHIK